jgi:DNA-binding NtrC family response regulator
MDEALAAQPLVLIADDDRLVRRMLRVVMEAGGCRTVEASGVAEAVAAFRASAPDAVLADHALGDGTALHLLEALAAIDPRVPLIVLTGQGSIGLAVEAMKRGAYHFLAKPADPDEVLRVVLGAVAERAHGSARDELDLLRGTSDAVRRLAADAARVAAAEGSVLLQGETGSGKSALARWIHARSPRGRGPFVPVDCAGLSSVLSDGALFGHERRRSTRASASRAGLVEAATGGTLFLDEIGDLDLTIQAKLLGVIEGRFLVGGSGAERPADVRVIASTQHDLEGRVAAGVFRRDLLFRVACLPVHLPPLRDRLEDLPLLVEDLLRGLDSTRGAAWAVGRDALERLGAHPWPGNLRELRNVLERALPNATRPALRAADLRFETAAAPERRAPSTLAEIERAEIERALVAAGYRVPAAARRLGIPRSTMYLRLRQYGIVIQRR